jgi:enoyl-CoA hydratase/carnithine racemase
MMLGCDVATSIAEYENRFETIRFERSEGILLVTFHTDGGSLRWGAAPATEMQEAFRAIADDPYNRVVIMTGAGDEFNGPKGSPASLPRASARSWEAAHWNVRRLLMNFLDIEAPVIAALNGPVYRHCETPLLADIVLASSTTIIQDSGHFVNGLIPGDGMHLVTQLVMGTTRARYFMLTGQEITADQALGIGIVNEVLPPEGVLPRAWELAHQLAQKSPLVLRYTKVAFVHDIKQRILASQGYGLLLEGMAAIDDTREGEGYDLPGRF